MDLEPDRNRVRAAALVASLVLALPTFAFACVACRNAAMAMVYEAGFIDTLLLLLLPVGLLLAGGIALYRYGRAAERSATETPDGRSV